MPNPARTAAPLPATETEAIHRLTAHLATLDLDPATLEILTAILTADIDLTPEDAATS